MHTYKKQAFQGQNPKFLSIEIYKEFFVIYFMSLYNIKFYLSTLVTAFIKLHCSKIQVHL